jgi:hypothetical protein
MRAYWRESLARRGVVLGWHEHGANSRDRTKPTSMDEEKVKLGGPSVADQLRLQPETCCSAYEIGFYSAAT